MNLDKTRHYMLPTTSENYAKEVKKTIKSLKNIHLRAKNQTNKTNFAICEIKRYIMANNEHLLLDFQARIRQLLLRFQEMKKENDELYAILDKNERQIHELKERLEHKSQQYDSLKIARMVAVADEDIDMSKKRLSKLIRDVNKCIAVLTEQKTE